MKKFPVQSLWMKCVQRGVKDCACVLRSIVECGKAGISQWFIPFFVQPLINAFFVIFQLTKRFVHSLHRPYYYDYEFYINIFNTKINN